MATNTSPEAHVPCNISIDRGQSMRAALTSSQSEVFSGVNDASRSRMALARRDFAIESECVRESNSTEQRRAEGKQRKNRAPPRSATKRWFLMFTHQPPRPWTSRMEDLIDHLLSIYSRERERERERERICEPISIVRESIVIREIIGNTSSIKETRRSRTTARSESSTLPTTHRPPIESSSSSRLPA